MRLALYCMLAALLPLPAAAADAPPPARLGLCAACHGADGHASSGQIPNLAGQNLAYLRAAAAQYRAGKRDDAAMRAALGMLGASDLDAVLRWYAAQPAATGTAPR